MASTAAANLLATLLSSVGGIFLARSLGATARGELVVVLLWPVTASTVASFGLTQATCYWVSHRRSEGAATMRAAARAALVTGLVVAGVGVVAAPTIGRTVAVVGPLRAMLLMSPLIIAGGVWMSALQAMNISRWNRARLVQPVAYSAGVITLSLLGRLTLTTATATYGLALVVQSGVALHLAHRFVERSDPSPPGVLRRLYHYGVRVWASTVPQVINVRLDQLALSILPAVTTGELGVYAVAASLSWLAMPAAIAFGSVAFPAVAGATDEATIRRIERTSLIGSAGAAAVTLVAVCAAAPFVVPRLFGSGFAGAVVPLWLLAPGTVFLAMNRVMDNLLSGRGRPLSTAAGEATAAVATIILLVALTPRYGIRGAAAASSVAYLCSSLILYNRLKAARRGPAAVPEGHPSE